MTPHAFITKWRASALKERSASQEHFIDLCHLLGEPTPADADPSGETYCFERGARKDTGGDGWADVWKRHHFAWEYKGQRADLDAAFNQLRQYSLALENPPLLIVSDMVRFRIRTNWTNSVSRTHEFELDDLADASTRDRLKWAFSDPDRLRPGETRQSLTERVAASFASVAQALRERGRGHDPQAVAHFVNRLVFCMFAADVGLLPDHMFTRMLRHARPAPERFVEIAGDLFEVMATGGRVGFETVAWFNGGLFDDSTALPLEKSDIETVLSASDLDWSEIDPSILGTLFERGLDPGKRAQLGAHYTDRDKIMLLVEPVVIRPLLVEWEAEKTVIATELERAEAAKSSAARTKRRNEAARRLRAFLDPSTVEIPPHRIPPPPANDPLLGRGDFRRPEIAEAEGDGVEGSDADGSVILRGGDQHPFALAELEGLQGAVGGVDEPQMTHLFAPIGGALAVEVELAGRRRENFAHPVGGQRGVRRVGKERHPLPPPTGEVGYEDVLAQMQLRFVDDPPAPRATRVVVKWTADLRAQRRTGVRVAHGRTRVRVEHTVNNLGDPMGGGIEYVLVGRPTALSRVMPQDRGDCFAHVASCDDSIARCDLSRRRRPLDSTCPRATPVRGRAPAASPDQRSVPRAKSPTGAPPRVPRSAALVALPAGAASRTASRVSSPVATSRSAIPAPPPAVDLHQCPGHAGLHLLGAANMGTNGAVPTPNISIYRRASGHAHAIYTLRRPVHRGDQARPHPLSILGRCSEWLCGALQADAGFTGVLVANPTHADYETIWNRTRPYTLAELRGFIPHGWRRPRVAHTDVGRNSDLHRALLRFAGVEDRTDAEVELYAHQLWRSIDVSAPHAFTVVELGDIIRSVLRYRAQWRARGWHRPGWLAARAAGGRNNTTEQQAAKGRIGGLRSGEARRSRTEERDERIIEHLDTGLSTREVARLVGLSQARVVQIRRRVRLDHKVISEASTQTG